MDIYLWWRRINNREAPKGIYKFITTEWEWGIILGKDLKTAKKIRAFNWIIFSE